jgi:hypothetical protein
MQNKQTAVEWLMDKLPTIDKYDPYYEDIIQQAKAMEKKQIKDAANWGTLYSDSNKSAEQYYNETYKQ